MRSLGAVYTEVRVRGIDSTRPITEKQSDIRCSTQSTDTHGATKKENAMTSSGPKAQGKSIMHSVLTGSLLRDELGRTLRRVGLVTFISETATYESLGLRSGDFEVPPQVLVL